MDAGHQPVFRDRNGLAGAATYQAVIDAERQPELFSNAGGIRPDQPADADDDRHGRSRAPVAAQAGQRRVHPQAGAGQGAESIGQLCDTLIDAVCERGECDFVRDLAAPLPMAVIGDMLGVLPERARHAPEMVRRPGGRPEFASARTSDMQIVMDCVRRISPTFTMGIIAARREEPTDDLISVLVNSEVDGERLTDDEIVMEDAVDSRSVATRPPGTR